jgi:resolvase-like protein
MSAPTVQGTVRCAVYTRISQDSEGRSLGVRRQEQDCRRLARDRGWSVAEVFTDNDLTAADPTVRRPAYERMLEGVAAGEFDAVLVYNQDRLVRQPIELERLFLTCQAESGYAGFGYQADKITVNLDEAALVKDAVARVLAGEERLLRVLNAPGRRHDQPMTQKLLTGIALCGECRETLNRKFDRHHKAKYFCHHCLGTVIVISAEELDEMVVEMVFTALDGDRPMAAVQHEGEASGARDVLGEIEDCEERLVELATEWAEDARTPQSAAPRERCWMTG